MAFAAPRGKFCTPSVTPVFIASLSLNEPNGPTGPTGPNEPISYWALPLGKFPVGGRYVSFSGSVALLFAFTDASVALRYLLLEKELLGLFWVCSHGYCLVALTGYTGTVRNQEYCLLWTGCKEPSEQFAFCLFVKSRTDFVKQQYVSRA